MNFFAKASAKRAELYFYDYIGGGFFDKGITAQTVTDAMKEFTPKADLDVFINSPGGAVFEGVAIYNILRRWDGKKRVHIDGIAASIASIIAMAGDSIEIASNGTMMIHRPYGMALGTADELRKTADSLDLVHDTILDTYVARTGGEKKEIDAWMRAETWMSADECVERGFATSKTEEKAIKAEFPLLASFKNTPETLKRSGLTARALIASAQARTASLNRRASPAKA